MTDLSTAVEPLDASRPAVFGGYVHRQGAELVDGTGRPLQLRGVGLGNWLLPEGYMWGFGDDAASPRQIEALIERLIGADQAAVFWRRFRDQFVTEDDIAEIARLGFDHVRLPINARVVQDEAGAPREEGYAVIDRLIEWCRKHRLWVLLDLHGAPGGQTGTNIDDSRHCRPELFMDETYRDRTIELWREVARRYASETVVLGYDLLNEPLPNEWQHQFEDQLVALYRDLTHAIRQIDADHLIMYEGTHWATSWSLFTELWDENSALQFHKYWSPADVASIGAFLETRRRLNVPIYMGEGGEHNVEWLFAAFRLYEAHGIGWNLWPWKKIDTLTSPISVVPPPGWDAILAAAAGARTELPHAERILDDLIGRFDIDRCDRREDVVRAVLADAPAVLPAWGYGFAGAGRSYSSAGSPSVPFLRAEDAVGLRFAAHQPAHDAPFAFTAGAPFDRAALIVADLDADDWLAFDVSDDTDAAWYTALGPDGQPIPARVTRTRGRLRVTATAATTLAWVVRQGADYPLVTCADHDTGHR